MVGECFWHLLPWDSGTFASTASGFVKKGSGGRAVMGSRVFVQPNLTLGNWGLSWAQPRSQIPPLLAVSDDFESQK